MLTSLPEVKAYLGVALTTTGDDVRLEALRAAAEQVVKRRTGQQLERGTYTEFHDGQGTKYLALRQRPVVSVADVRLDAYANWGQTAGSFGATTVLPAGDDYALVYDGTDPAAGTAWSRCGLLARVGTVWPERNRFYQPGRLVADVGPSLGNVRVTYTAGYADCPEDLRFAVAALVQWMRRVAQWGAQLPRSEKIGDYAYSLYDAYRKTDAALGSIEQICASHRDQPI